MSVNGYRSADESAPTRRPSGKPEVWRARDRRTGAYLGVVVSESWVRAKERAAALYAVPAEAVMVEQEVRR